MPECTLLYLETLTKLCQLGLYLISTKT